MIRCAPWQALLLMVLCAPCFAEAPPDLPGNPLPTKLPSGFWAAKPKAAALALVQANLPAKLPPDFQIAFDDREAGPAPEIASIAFSTGQAQYFLRLDPKGSYLAYGQRWDDRINFRANFLYPPSADLRLCPVPYRDARQLAHVIWWLDHLRTRGFTDSPDSMMRGYADDAGHPGSGWLTLRDAQGGVLLDDTKRLWQITFSLAFNGYCDREATINFINFLFKQALPERLGPTWIKADPNPKNPYASPSTLYSAAEQDHLRDVTLRLLALSSPAQDHLSFAVASCAARAAGELTFPEATPLLQKIVASLPAPTSPLRLPEEVFLEENQLFHDTPKDASESVKSALGEKVRAFSAERDAIKLGTTAGQPRELRDTAETALRQIRDANNIDALTTWATTPEPGNYWALWRVSVLDPTRYPLALEWWLKHTYPVEHYLILRDLKRVAPERAKEILATLPPDQKT